MRGTRFAELNAFVAVAEQVKLHKGGAAARALHRNTEPDGARAGRSSRRAIVELHHAQRRADRRR